MSTVRVLVVAGGGGAGGAMGGGGGAGGYIHDTSFVVTAQAYTVTVGSGGNGGFDVQRGANGQASVFDSLSATGGGGGGGYSFLTGNSGGSGGGGGNPSRSGGAGTGSQGYAGGNGTSAFTGAGGGGASEVGATAGASNGGVGGDGIENDISGTATYYAGGGGGGGYYIYADNTAAGGLGGGGEGRTGDFNGGAATANTGGGGGGAGYHDQNPKYTGGAGGSGIVIISFATNGSDGVSTDSTGGTITTSGGNTIHTFTSGGTFTMVEAIVNPDVDVNDALTLSENIDIDVDTPLLISVSEDVAISEFGASGPNDPSAASSDSSGRLWSNPSNVYTENASYATSGPTETQNSQILHASDFGFSIPATANITGLVAEIKKYRSGNSFSETLVQLYIGGVLTGNNKGSGTLPTSNTYETYGSATDLWGTSITPADINASDFGLAFRGSHPDFGNSTAFVDHMRITVYYALLEVEVNLPDLNVTVNDSVSIEDNGNLGAPYSGYIREVFDEITLSENISISQVHTISTFDEVVVTDLGSYGPNVSSVETSTSTGSGWGAVTNVRAEDGAEALSSSETNASQILKMTGFGFSIPNGTPITGVQVDIKKRRTGGSSVTETLTQLYVGDVLSGDNKSTGATLPTSATYTNYGGIADLWGLNLTAGDINASDFGVGYRVYHNDFGTSVARVDHVQITVYTGLSIEMTSGVFAYDNITVLDNSGGAVPTLSTQVNDSITLLENVEMFTRVQRPYSKKKNFGSLYTGSASKYKKKKKLYT